MFTLCMLQLCECIWYLWVSDWWTSGTSQFTTSTPFLSTAEHCCLATLKTLKMSLFCSFECEAIAKETHRVSYNSLCMFIINSQIFSKIYLINYQWCVVNIFTKNLLKQKDINLFVVVYACGYVKALCRVELKLRI